jgi:hypothetical protein
MAPGIIISKNLKIHKFNRYNSGYASAPSLSLSRSALARQAWAMALESLPCSGKSSAKEKVVAGFQLSVYNSFRRGREPALVLDFA